MGSSIKGSLIRFERVFLPTFFVFFRVFTMFKVAYIIVRYFYDCDTSMARFNKMSTFEIMRFFSKLYGRIAETQSW